MVKIRIKSLLIGLIVFILFTNVAYAAGSKLIFSDVDVKVGSKTSKNLDDGDSIDDEAEPGDTVEFRIEVKNNFTNAEDLEIEDITVTTTIEEIDDGDDLDEESSDFNLKAGRDKRVTLKFEVPLEVDEDTFDVTIEAEGEDENGTDHRATMRLRLDVEKENHLLKITRRTLNPGEISCNRRNVQVGVTVLNLGSEDEEDVKVQVFNEDLGVDFRDDIDELTAEPNEDESRFSKTYTLNVPNAARADSYPIAVRALYDNDRKKAEELLTLTVNDCGTKEVSEKTEEDEVEVVSPPSTKDETTTVVVQAVPSGTTVSEEGFLSGNAIVVGVIIAEIIAVIVGIVLIVVLFARRE